MGTTSKAVKEKLLQDCVTYMRQILEGTADRSAGGDIINQLQKPGGFIKDSDQRNTLVTVFADPQIQNSKIYAYGPIAEEMLVKLKEKIEAGTTLEECKDWIVETYKELYNYALRYHDHIVEDKATPVKPTHLSSSITLMIEQAILNPKALQTRVQWSQEWVPDFKEAKTQEIDLDKMTGLSKKHVLKLKSFFTKANDLKTQKSKVPEPGSPKSPKSPKDPSVEFFKKVETKLTKYKQDKELKDAEVAQLTEAFKKKLGIT